jgi:hypothetical protein
LNPRLVASDRPTLPTVAYGDLQQKEQPMTRHHHRITPTIALTLALAAATAPTAWADPQPLARAEAAIANHATPASTGPCSEVCSGGAGSYGPVSQPAWTNQDAGARLPHDPRPRSAALATSSDRSLNVATRTLATPVSCGDVCSGHGYGPVTAPATVIRVAAPGGGFDWGDAGIGAAGAIVLMLIGTGRVLATTNRRGRRAHQEQANA